LFNASSTSTYGIYNDGLLECIYDAGVKALASLDQDLKTKDKTKNDEGIQFRSPADEENGNGRSTGNKYMDV
jgi:hypothetical protein